MDTRTHIMWTMEDARRRTLKFLEDMPQSILSWRPSDNSNSIGSITIHIARVEDALSVGSLGLNEQIFATHEWHQQLRLSKDDWGWGFDALPASQQPGVELLVSYLHAVRERTLPFIQALSPERLQEEVPGRRIRTVAQSLSFIVNEELQHLGQMDYLKGLIAASGG